MVSAQNPVVIFTDGACSGNPGPGGWASIVALPDGTVHELAGGHDATTNNRMEMAATIHALAMLDPAKELPITLYTDSTYVIKGITQWIFGWRNRGWKSSDGKDVANRDMWEELLRQVMRLKPVVIDWKYVRGHAGYPGNERCDEIAVSYSKKKPEKLYVGPRDGYFVDLTQLPADEPMPERSAASAPGSAKRSSSSSSSSSSGGFRPSSSSGPVKTTYLSYQNGVVSRFATWAECERQVKGRPNVKFKKAKSAQEEREIVVGWGLDARSLPD
ncbi:hypothetical protein BH11CYA1_BH11CYA1_09550 [soil metagenome]